MVFRKESRADSFQRQISNLRQQLGADVDDEEFFDDAEPMPDEGDQESEAPQREALRPVGTTQPPVPPAPAATASTGVIAADSVWSGTLQAQGSLQIFGRVEGELTSDDEVYVAAGAVVAARVRARTIVVAGTIDGAVECDGRLEVLPSGIVSGEVVAQTLVVHEGATIAGELRTLASESQP